MNNDQQHRNKNNNHLTGKEDLLFDKMVREKLYHFTVPEETGNWEALALRMARREALRRRRRWTIPAAARQV